jgi:hypothetical protein
MKHIKKTSKSRPVQAALFCAPCWDIEGIIEKAVCVVNPEAEKCGGGQIIDPPDGE